MGPRTRCGPQYSQLLRPLWFWNVVAQPNRLTLMQVLPSLVFRLRQVRWRFKWSNMDRRSSTTRLMVIHSSLIRLNVSANRFFCPECEKADAWSLDNYNAWVGSASKMITITFSIPANIQKVPVVNQLLLPPPLPRRQQRLQHRQEPQRDSTMSTAIRMIVPALFLKAPVQVPPKLLIVAFQSALIVDISTLASNTVKSATVGMLFGRTLSRLRKMNARCHVRAIVSWLCDFSLLTHFPYYFSL